jgi:hypothetical protein
MTGKIQRPSAKAARLSAEAEAVAGPSTRRLVLVVPVALHKALRRAAFERETTMVDVVIGALERDGVRT